MTFKAPAVDQASGSKPERRAQSRTCLTARAQCPGLVIADGSKRLGAAGRGPAAGWL